MEIIIYLLSLVFKYKIIAKTGEKGWKAIIPIYSDYIIAKKGGQLWPFFAVSAANILVLFMNPYLLVWISPDLLAYLWGSESHTVVSMTVYVVLLLASCVFASFMYANLAEKFGKRRLLGALAGFVPIVGLAILAFSGTYSDRPNLVIKDKKRNEIRKSR